jgi:hypothetical protein
MEESTGQQSQPPRKRMQCSVTAGFLPRRLTVHPLQSRMHRHASRKRNSSNHSVFGLVFTRWTHYSRIFLGATGSVSKSLLKATKSSLPSRRGAENQVEAPRDGTGCGPENTRAEGSPLPTLCVNRGCRWPLSILKLPPDWLGDRRSKVIHPVAMAAQARLRAFRFSQYPPAFCRA